MRDTKGITLIALIITIIVLLILAGVSIATLTGEGGILTKAKQAEEETTKEKIIEQAKVDIFGKQTENLGSLTEKEWKDILGKYGTLSENGETSIFDKILTTKEEKYEIKVSEIYNGKLEKEKGKVEFSIRSFGSDRDGYVGDYVVDEGCTWREFFVREFPNAEWDEDDNWGSLTPEWWEYKGKIVLVDIFHDTSGPRRCFTFK